MRFIPCRLTEQMIQPRCKIPIHQVKAAATEILPVRHSVALGGLGPLTKTQRQGSTNHVSVHWPM